MSNPHTKNQPPIINTKQSINLVWGSNPVQKKIDQFWAATLFKITPAAVRPNHLTYLRFILIPVTLYFLASRHFTTALILFFVAALADTLDGSLARVRRKASGLGTFLDPIADKLLTMLVFIFLAYFYPWSDIIILVISLDLFILVSGIFVFTVLGMAQPAVNWWGKAKLVLEAVVLLNIFCYLIFSMIWLFWLSILLLGLILILDFFTILDYAVKAISQE